jgi:hypothetical protein
MKKNFESFAPCLELREVIFLRQLPVHAHLVPALDIFLDPHTKKLHIAMEYMDGNLYQLMKAREGKLLEGSVVKSILWVPFALRAPYFCSFVTGSKSSLDSNTSTQMVSSIAISSQRTFWYRLLQLTSVKPERSGDILQWLLLRRLLPYTPSRLQISVWPGKQTQSSLTRHMSLPDGTEPPRCSSVLGSTAHLWTSGRWVLWPLRLQP